MFGHASISEASFGDVGGVVQVATAEMSGTASKTSIGVGILAGIATMDGNFTATTAGIFITGSVNAELSSNFTQTTENIRLVNLTDVTISSVFTQTTDGINILIPIVSTDLNFTKTTSGDILYENIGETTGKRPAGASSPGSGYTEISPLGVESYSNITPSGSETWSEI
jgi:hypothetical protein